VNTPLFPFRLAAQEDRFFVLENQSPDQSIQPGTEVVSINGQTMKQIRRALLPYFGGDGDIETGTSRHLARNLSVAYSIVIEPAETFDVKFRDANGTHTGRVAGVKRAELQSNAKSNPVNAAVRDNGGKLEWTRENIALRFLRDPEIAQLRIGGFGGRDFPAQLEKQFATLREKNTRTLIIDLRGNGGGADNLGALLVSFLTDQPFRYFEKIRMRAIDPPREHTNFPNGQRERLKTGSQANPEGGFLILPSIHSGLSLQSPSKSAFPGKVFMLIDGGCFSTCADVAAVTHHLKRATFIGEETGGGYYGNNSGAGMTLTLPNSKIPVSIPMWEYWNAVPGYSHKRRGTIPDHKVMTRVADLIVGRDAALEKALALAK
jgi:hypothetical protein